MHALLRCRVGPEGRAGRNDIKLPISGSLLPPGAHDPEDYQVGRTPRAGVTVLVSQMMQELVMAWGMEFSTARTTLLRPQGYDFTLCYTIPASILSQWP